MEEKPLNRIIFNEDQVKAIEEIIEWANDPETLFATLTGPAGTGKTTVLRYILDNIKVFSKAVAAPTHKAVEVVKRVTKCDGFTVPALLGLALDTDMADFDINNVKFSNKNEPKLPEYSLVAIDESSMLNKDAVEFIFNLAAKSNTKVLFMGDEFQLPPVKENISIVFTSTRLNLIARLYKPARQKPTNPLAVLLLALRFDIKPENETSTYLIEAIKAFNLDTQDPTLLPFICNPSNWGKVYKRILERFPTLVGDDASGYKTTSDVNEFATELVADFQTEDFNEDNGFVKYLAYTNDAVETYNKGVRNMLYDFPESPVVVGDFILGYTTITVPNGMGKTTNILTNSEEYSVLDVIDGTSEDEIPVYAITIQGLNSNKTVINIVKEEGLELFKKIHNEKRESAIYYVSKGWGSKKWVEYYKFKNRHLLIHNLLKSEKDASYPKKDIDYAYGLTVHKSQGSTYFNTYIDSPNIRNAFNYTYQYLKNQYNGNIPKDELDAARIYALKLMYVALSRTANFCTILI